MRLLSRSIASLLLAAVCTAPVLMTGCAVHARVYDPYYHDYHHWDGETVHYQQWEHDTHRQHEDFKHRNAADQKDYWTWRHDHH